MMTYMIGFLCIFHNCALCAAAKILSVRLVMESSIHASTYIASTHIFNCHVNDWTCVVAQPCGALVPLYEAHERESC